MKNFSASILDYEAQLQQIIQRWIELILTNNRPGSQVQIFSSEIVTVEILKVQYIPLYGLHFRNNEWLFCSTAGSQDEIGW